MTPDIGGFTGIVRVLVQGFDGGHAASFFAQFDAIGKHDGASSKGDAGIAFESHVSPLG
jgi:hypothetical protein